MSMTITWNTIITVAAIVTAAGVIGGLFLRVLKWIQEQNSQSEKIKNLQAEQRVIVKAQLACLKGLHEQGCNGPVTEAINMLEEHINTQAHK